MEKEFVKEAAEKSASETGTGKKLNKLLRFSEQNEYATAIWRLPNESDTHQIIDTNGFQSLEDVDLEKLGKGFLFCPYDQGEKAFIKGDIHYSSAKEKIEFREGLDPAIIENYQNDQTTETKRMEGPEVTDTSKADFIQLVKRSISQITEDRFQKVVPSKVKKVEISPDFDIIENFQILTKAYPRAFVFYVSIPSVGTWMGATPETLIEIENGSVFRTVSLAGTQKYVDKMNPSDIAWTQKDIEEQAMVSRYIINCFKKIRLREFSERGPKTVVAANLMHLKTIFEVNIKETGFYNLGTVMLELLHPTSAVCGMPKENASSFLKANEEHQRKYYSGFLGPVNNNEDTHLFVNLRCMEIFKNHAVLYAGSGITEDSDPEKEWLETEMKCNTLLNVIKTK